MYPAIHLCKLLSITGYAQGQEWLGTPRPEKDFYEGNEMEPTKENRLN